MNIQTPYREFKIDWLSAALVALVVVFQSASIIAAPYARRFATVPETQSTNVELSVGLIIILVVESLIIVGAWRLWRGRSELIKKVLKCSILISLGITAGYVSYVGGVMQRNLLIIGAGCVFIGLDHALERVGLDWITFNTLALGLGVGATSMLSNSLAPIVVIPFLILAILWDHFAVNLSDIMGDLVEFSASASLPNYLIIPLRLQVDYEAVSDYVKDADVDKKPPGVAGIIGVGDFALPASLVVSAWITGATIPAVAAAVGTVLSTVVLRDSMERADGGLPALPWLNTGALAGFAVGVFVAGISVVTAVGL